MISILEVKHNYGIDRLGEEYNKVEGQWQRIKATEKKMGGITRSYDKNRSRRRSRSLEPYDYCLRKCVQSYVWSC